MRVVSVKTLFMIVASVLVIGFILFGTVTYSLFERLRVNGPVYTQIVDSKDLIADILPPPLYVIEANLVFHSAIFSTNKNELEKYQEQLNRLIKEFNDRELHWQTSQIDDRLAGVISKELVPSGNAFLTAVKRELALVDFSADDHEKLERLARVQELYQQHRAIVDRLVADAQSHNKVLEERAAADLNFSHYLLTAIFIVSLFGSLTIALLASRKISRLLGAEPAEAQAYVAQIAQGNLKAESNKQVPAKSLMEGILTMQSRISDIVTGISSVSKEMTQSIFHIALTSKEISLSTDIQTQETKAVDEATKELREILISVQNITEKARLKTHDVEMRAEEGLASLVEIVQQMELAVESVHASENSMKGLETSGGEINDILLSIKTISDQTNLLALNAAIEAARAGEQGRGFAVVADEVRTLAIKTGMATSIIQQIVDDLNSKIRNTLESMTRVSLAVARVQEKANLNGTVIQRMASEARESSQFSLQIAAISEDQITRIGLLDTRLHKLFAAMNANFSTLDMIASISNSLHHAVDTLQDKIRFFKFSNQTQQNEALNDKRAHSRIKNSLFLTIHCKDNQFLSRTRDFSLGGLSFFSKNPLHVYEGEWVLLEIKPPANEVNGYIAAVSIKLSAKIVRIGYEQEEHVYAVEFEDCSPDVKMKLEKIVRFYS